MPTKRVKVEANAEPVESIVFVRDYDVKAAGGAKYKAGDKAELPASSASHFVNRGAAVYQGEAPNASDTQTESKADDTGN